MKKFEITQAISRVLVIFFGAAFIIIGLACAGYGFSANANLRKELVGQNTAKINEYMKFINSCHKYLDRAPPAPVTLPTDLTKLKIIRFEYYQQMIDERESCKNIYPTLPTHQELFNYTIFGSAESRNWYM